MKTKEERQRYKKAEQSLEKHYVYWQFKWWKSYSKNIQVDVSNSLHFEFDVLWHMTSHFILAHCLFLFVIYTQGESHGYKHLLIWFLSVEQPITKTLQGFTWILIFINKILPFPRPGKEMMLSWRFTDVIVATQTFKFSQTIQV